MKKASSQALGRVLDLSQTPKSYSLAHQRLAQSIFTLEYITPDLNLSAILTCLPTTHIRSPLNREICRIEFLGVQSGGDIPGFVFTVGITAAGEGAAI